jgi:hypothetical protein
LNSERPTVDRQTKIVVPYAPLSLFLNAGHHRSRVLPVERAFLQVAAMPGPHGLLEASRAHGFGLKCAAESRVDQSQSPNAPPLLPGRLTVIRFLNQKRTSLPQESRFAGQTTFSPQRTRQKSAVAVHFFSPLTSHRVAIEADVLGKIQRRSARGAHKPAVFMES